MFPTPGPAACATALQQRPGAPCRVLSCTTGSRSSRCSSSVSSTGLSPSKQTQFCARPIGSSQLANAEATSCPSSSSSAHSRIARRRTATGAAERLAPLRATHGSTLVASASPSLSPSAAAPAPVATPGLSALHNPRRLFYASAPRGAPPAADPTPAPSTPPPTSAAAPHPSAPSHAAQPSPTPPAPSASHADFSSHADVTPHADVTLVTQISLDRWPRFAQAALAWGGPVSVAVYVPCPPHHPLAHRYEQHLAGAVQGLLREARGAQGAGAERGPMAAASTSSDTRSSGAGAGSGGGGGGGGAGASSAPLLTVSVLYTLGQHLAGEGAAVLQDPAPDPAPAHANTSPAPPAPTPAPASAAHGSAGDVTGTHPADAVPYGPVPYEALYPINALRNAALEAAATSHVWLVDGDFVPSAGLYDSLVGAVRSDAVQYGAGRAPELAGGAHQQHGSLQHGGQGVLVPLPGQPQGQPLQVQAQQQGQLQQQVQQQEQQQRPRRPVPGPFSWARLAGAMALTGCGEAVGDCTGGDCCDGDPDRDPRLAGAGAGAGAGATGASTGGCGGGNAGGSGGAAAAQPPLPGAASGGAAGGAVQGAGRHGRQLQGGSDGWFSWVRLAGAMALVGCGEAVEGCVVEEEEHAPAGGQGARAATAAAAAAVGGSGGASWGEEPPAARPRPVMWVVPAFELKGAAAGGVAGGGGGGEGLVDEGLVDDGVRARVPRTVRELAACAGRAPGGAAAGGAAAAGTGGLAAGAGAPSLVPFHCGRYPQPVPSVDYEAWWRGSMSSGVAAGGPAAGSSAGAGSGGEAAGAGAGGGGGGGALRWVEAPYHEYFEPYGVARKDQVPRFDERFRGYGLNKVQHAYAAAAAGFEFRLLLDHFCVTVPHARSPSYRAAFGTAADPQQRRTVEQLYDSFKQEVQQQYGWRYGV